MSFNRTVNARIPAGDFPRIWKMVMDYVKSKWLITNPDKAGTNPIDFQSKVRFGDWDYDGNSTYYVKVKEETSRFDNELKGTGLLGWITPVSFLLTARRLKYGKAFEELDNIRMEIVRIIGQYKPDEISGLGEMEIVDPGDVESDTIYVNKLPKSIFRAQVTAELLYWWSYS